MKNSDDTGKGKRRNGPKKYKEISVKKPTTLESVLVNTHVTKRLFWGVMHKGARRKPCVRCKTIFSFTRRMQGRIPSTRHLCRPCEEIKKAEMQEAIRKRIAKRVFLKEIEEKVIPQILTFKRSPPAGGCAT